MWVSYNGATPKSFILDWDVPWNKPSISEVHHLWQPHISAEEPHFTHWVVHRFWAQGCWWQPDEGPVTWDGMGCFFDILDWLGWGALWFFSEATLVLPVHPSSGARTGEEKAMARAPKATAQKMRITCGSDVAMCTNQKQGDLGQHRDFSWVFNFCLAVSRRITILW